MVEANENDISLAKNIVNYVLEKSIIGATLQELKVCRQIVKVNCQINIYQLLGINTGTIRGQYGTTRYIKYSIRLTNTYSNRHFENTLCSF